MVVSYQAVTTASISHNVFVSFDKEGKEWYYLLRLVPELIQHEINYSWNKKCTLNIKGKPVMIYNKNYTDIHLKQSNIISFNTLHL